MLLSPRFSNLKEAQETLSKSAFFLLDIHQVLFHRRGLRPLLRGIMQVKEKPQAFKEGLQALCSSKTWKTLHLRFNEGNRVTEAYLNATRHHPFLHSELLNYSNTIFTADADLQALLADLKNEGHKLYLLSNIGNVTLERLRQKHPDYFALLASPHNTINQNSLETESFIWKPQPQAYQQALHTIGQLKNPHHAIFIDDTRRNVVAAHEAGMNAILFKSFRECKKAIQALLGKISSPE